jgi:hypothetical protein
MKDAINLIQKVIDKGYDKETLRISAYWDLRDDIDFFWRFVEMAKEIGMGKFIETYKDKK